MRKLFLLCFFVGLLLSDGKAQTARNVNYYLQQGVQNSPLLKDYINQVEANKIDSLRIIATQYPQVNAFSTVMQAPVFNGIGYDNAITNGGQFAAGVAVTKPILNHKILKAQYETITIQNAIVKNTAQLGRHDLEKQITDQYIATYQDNVQFNFTTKVVGTLENETTVLKELFTKGVGKQSDYMAVSIELQSQQIALEQQKTQYQSDLLLLNAICGISDTNSVQLAPPALNLKTQYDRKASPFFYKFTIDSLGFENQRRLADTRYKPHFNLFGDAGLNSSQLTGIYQTIGFSAGLSFIMPLYDGHQRKLDYKKADFSELTRKSYQDFFHTKYALQLMQTYNELAGNKRIMVKLQQQLKDIDILLKLTQQQLLNGTMSTVEYVVILRNYLETNNALNQALIKEQLLISENNYWMF